MYWISSRVRTNVCNLLCIFYSSFNMCQPGCLVKKINRTDISTRNDLTFISGGGGGMMAELWVGRLQNLRRISRLCSNFCEVWSHQEVFNDGPQQFNVCRCDTTGYKTLKKLLCLNLTSTMCHKIKKKFKLNLKKLKVVTLRNVKLQDIQSLQDQTFPTCIPATHSRRLCVIWLSASPFFSRPAAASCLFSAYPSRPPSSPPLCPGLESIPHSLWCLEFKRDQKKISSFPTRVKLDTCLI